MKTAFNFSILLNLLLAIGLAVLLLHQASTAHSILQNNPPATFPAKISIAESPASNPAPSAAWGTVLPFRWNQLDSKDYHVYVKNLRAIGCPEPTVRAIVTADVDSVYHIVACQMEQKLADLQNGSLTDQLKTSVSEETLRNQLQSIPDQETAKIADFLGLQLPSSQPTNPRSAVVFAGRIVPISTPLVMENIDFAALNLNADQMEEIANLRQTFSEQVGSPGQNPNDPAYAMRWRRAQLATDSMLQGMLGYDVYTKIQTAQMQAQNEQAGTSN